MWTMKRLLASLSVALAAACASQTKLPEPARAAIADRHVHRLVELKRSYYYGDLYDENEKWLLSPYPFNDTYHIVDLDGAPIHPKMQRGTLPAGTNRPLERAEFPHTFAISKRTLTTTRYNTWSCV